MDIKEVRAAGAYGWQTYHLRVPIVLKSRNVKLQEPSVLSQGLLYPYRTQHYLIH